MSATTTMTIRMPREISARLDQLSHDTRRSRSFLAAEAVAAYVEREQAIVGGIKRGLADAAAGRLVPHDSAMAELTAAINAASAHCVDVEPADAL